MFPGYIHSQLPTFIQTVKRDKSEDEGVNDERTYSPGKAFVVYEINRHVYIVSAFLPSYSDASVGREERYLSHSTITDYHTCSSVQSSHRGVCMCNLHFILCRSDIRVVCVCVFCSSLYCSLDCSRTGC
jgi:hypothetical protein